MKKQNEKTKKGKIEKIKVGVSNNKNVMCLSDVHLVHGNGQRFPPHMHKFVDTTATTTITSAGATAALTSIAQGNQVGQRDGDMGTLQQFFFNFSCDAANADIFTRSRIILFQWYPNTALIAPVIGNILQTASPYAFYNYDLSNQYHIIKDFMISSAGLAAAPTSASSIFFGDYIDIRSCKKRMEWSPASVNGSNQLFLLYVSDSLIAPFPNFVYNSRVVYTDVE
jgi:hypothetical protein